MEIKTKLDRRKIERFYDIIFWWRGGASIPNTWCGLTWKTVGGILFLPIASFFMLLTYVLDVIAYILPAINISGINRVAEKVLDKIEPVTSNSNIKYFILGISLLIGLSAFPLKNVLNSSPVWCQVIWILFMCFSVIFIFATIVLGIVWLIIYGAGLLFKTKLGVKVTNKIEMVWDVFWEKYCPLIKWK